MQLDHELDSSFIFSEIVQSVNEDASGLIVEAKKKAEETSSVPQRLCVEPFLIWLFRAHPYSC